MDESFFCLLYSFGAPMLRPSVTSWRHVSAIKTVARLPATTVMTTAMLPLTPACPSSYEKQAFRLGSVVPFLAKVIPICIAACAKERDAAARPDVLHVTEGARELLAALQDVQESLTDFETAMQLLGSQRPSGDMFLPETVVHFQTCALQKALRTAKVYASVRHNRERKQADGAALAKRRKVEEDAGGQDGKRSFPKAEHRMKEHESLWRDLTQATLPEVAMTAAWKALPSAKFMRGARQEVETVTGTRLICQAMGCAKREGLPLVDSLDAAEETENEERHGSATLRTRIMASIGGLVRAVGRWLRLCTNSEDLPRESPTTCTVLCALRGDLAIFFGTNRSEDGTLMEMCAAQADVCRRFIDVLVRQRRGAETKSPYDWPRKKDPSGSAAREERRNTFSVERCCEFTGSALLEDDTLPDLRASMESEPPNFVRSLALVALGDATASQERPEEDADREARWRIARATVMSNESIVATKWPISEPMPPDLQHLVEAKRCLVIPPDVPRENDARDAFNWVLLLSDAMTPRHFQTLAAVHDCIKQFSPPLCRFDEVTDRKDLASQQKMSHAEGDALISRICEALVPGESTTPSSIGASLRHRLNAGATLAEAVNVIRVAITDCEETCFRLPDSATLSRDVVTFVIFATMAPRFRKSNLHFQMRHRLRWREGKNPLEGDCCIRGSQAPYTAPCKKVSYANQCGFVVSFDASVAVRRAALGSITLAEDDDDGRAAVPLRGTEGLLLCDLVAIVCTYARIGDGPRRKMRSCAVVKSQHTLSGTSVVCKIRAATPKKHCKVDSRILRTLYKSEAKEDAHIEGPPALTILPCASPCQVRVAHPWILEEAAGNPVANRCLKGKSPLEQLAQLDYILVRAPNGCAYAIDGQDVSPRLWI